MFKDMVKDLAVRVFLIHLAAFVAGVLICAAINLWLSPGTLWFPWVALGWGAALATHAFALFLRKARRRERIFVDRKARSFAVHLFAYVATVLILLYVNLTVTPDVCGSIGWRSAGARASPSMAGARSSRSGRDCRLTLPPRRRKRRRARRRSEDRGSVRERA